MDVFSSPYWGITDVWQVIVAGMIHEIKERDGEKKGDWIHTSNKLRLDSGMRNLQHVTSLRTIVSKCGLMSECIIRRRSGCNCNCMAVEAQKGGVDNLLSSSLRRKGTDTLRRTIISRIFLHGFYIIKHTRSEEC